MEPKESSTRKNTDTSKLLETDENATILSTYPEALIDLPKLSTKKSITNSEILLSILEICTYNRKYNYDCSNNTKAFWDRVVEEGILKKIFKNFKSETLRKYWKVIRQSGNTLKFLEVVKQNENFINTPSFKLMTLVNAIAYFIQTNETDFEVFFTVFNSKDKKSFIEREEPLKTPINLIPKKRASPENDRPILEKEDKKETKLFINNEEIIIETVGDKDSKCDKCEKDKDNKENKDDISENKKMKEKAMDWELIWEEKKLEMENANDFDENIDKLVNITKFNRDDVSEALFGTSGNIRNAFLYLNDKEKYKKYFFNENEDDIIKNKKDSSEYNILIDNKGIELVKEREKFFSIN